ncbi:hypothetical protein [Alloscardovia omnicolens]|uniref:hypothetical protein n=1 Tax=Alloscardovia omnicolens TaxID=419015 RepID=UPI00066820BA|nr:hypothetical protein [Alloscardovia omnicolens]
MTDNTQNAPYQDFSQNDAPAAAPAQAAMPVAPSQTSAEKKKTFLHIAIGFIVGAALIAPTTWMIASSSAHDTMQPMSQNMQGGPDGSNNSGNSGNSDNSNNTAPQDQTHNNNNSQSDSSNSDTNS